MGGKAAVTIDPVTAANLDAAAEAHAVSWRASHAAICAPDFVAAHTAARQRAYLARKLEGGSRIFLLMDDTPAGLISVTGSLIEDLYVRPEKQGQGYGSALLRHALRECTGTPKLWLLETNKRARLFYEHRGFRPTGKIDRSHGPLAEIEYALDTRPNPEPEPLLETDRLLVRRFTPEDAVALHAVLSDPEVMRYLEPPFTLEQTERFLQRAGLCEPPLVWAVIWKQTNEVIGHLIWHPWDEGAMELGWVLCRDFWGRGLAKELTAALLAREDRDVVIECSPEQAATGHIAELFGFIPVTEGQALTVWRRSSDKDIRWIFFDLGSTLIDETEADRRRIGEMTAGTAITPETYREKRLECIRQGLPGDQAAIAFFGLTKTPWHSELERPWPDAAPTLAELKRRGYRLGVIANQNPGTEARLAAWDLLRYFDIVAPSAELGVAKPDPAIFRWALDRAGCEPAEAVMVGDRLDNDVAPAKALGLHTVRILRSLGAYHTPRTAEEAPEYTIRDLTGLLTLFRAPAAP